MKIYILLITFLIAVAAGCVEQTQQSYSVLSNYPKLFENNVIIAVGENATQIERDGAKVIAYDLADLTGNEPLIKTDIEITEKEKTDYNLIIVGKPDANILLRDVYARTNATRVTDEYPGEGKGILEILKNPWNQSVMMLLVQGSDGWGVRAGSVVLEEKQKVNGKDRVVVDWEEATGIKFPIDNAEEAIKYTNMDVNAKRFIKKWSSMGNKINVDATFSNSSNNWDIEYRAITPIEENWFKIVINSNGTIIDKGGFL